MSVLVNFMTFDFQVGISYQLLTLFKMTQYSKLKPNKCLTNCFLGKN
jgi:hypothetical protein